MGFHSNYTLYRGKKCFLCLVLIENARWQQRSMLMYFGSQRMIKEEIRTFLFLFRRTKIPRIQNKKKPETGSRERTFCFEQILYYPWLLSLCWIRPELVFCVAVKWCLEFIRYRSGECSELEKKVQVKFQSAIFSSCSQDKLQENGGLEKQCGCCRVRELSKLLFLYHHTTSEGRSDSALYSKETMNF